MRKLECKKGHITTYEILAMPGRDSKYWTCSVSVYREGKVVRCGERIRKEELSIDAD